VVFELDSIVPWGRSFDEYVRMFDLGADELRLGILDCGGGPSAFTAGMAAGGRRAASVDPLYACTREEIARRIDEATPTVLEQTRRTAANFVWDEFGSVEGLGRARMAAMRAFLEDYERGRAEGRYLAGELPSLPVPEDAFDLAVSSHLLFVYAGRLDLAWHIRSVTDMLRVAPEARIFPLCDLTHETSALVEPVRGAFTARGFRVEIRRVPYEFVRGARHMMRITRPAFSSIEPSSGV
jgi:hypothetical protein